MESMPDVSIVSHFKDLPDPRIERAKKHRLIDIIVIAPGSESGAGSGSIMVGGDGFQDMELFGKSKQAWLEQLLDLPNGIPSHDTFGRVFARLKSQTLPSVLPVMDPGRLQAHPRRRGLARWQNRQSVV